MEMVRHCVRKWIDMRSEMQKWYGMIFHFVETDWYVVVNCNMQADLAHYMRQEDCKTVGTIMD